MRQIRSYHRAFSSELLIFSLGTGMTLYRPLPVRRVVWTGMFVGLVWLLVHVLRWDLPMLTLAWGFAYVVVPVALGYVFAAGEIEGRKLHVIAPIYAKHVFSPRGLVGGWRPLEKRPERMRIKRVKVW